MKDKGWNLFQILKLRFWCSLTRSKVGFSGLKKDFQCHGQS